MSFYNGFKYEFRSMKELRTGPFPDLVSDFIFIYFDSYRKADPIVALIVDRF